MTATSGFVSFAPSNFARRGYRTNLEMVCSKSALHNRGQSSTAFRGQVTTPNLTEEGEDGEVNSINVPK